jgi:phosphoribosylformylglycinamidine cyclo-ligase
LVNELGETETFLDAILKPHTCYYQPFKGLFETNCDGGLHGLAHITGGGIAGNLCRILPEGMDAVIDASKLRVLPLFKKIQVLGKVAEADMLRTFNMGIGMTLVCAPGAVAAITAHLAKFKLAAYPIGQIVAGGKAVIRYENRVTW